MIFRLIKSCQRWQEIFDITEEGALGTKRKEQNIRRWAIPKRED